MVKIYLFICLCVGFIEAKSDVLKFLDKKMDNTVLKKHSKLEGTISQKEEFRITELNSQINDTIKKGISFYRLTDFKGYKYIEMDPYEDFLINENNDMYHVIIFEKKEFRYTIIAVLDKNIGEGELSDLWKKTKKEVTDIIKYEKRFSPCWNYSFRDDNVTCCLFPVFDEDKINYDPNLGVTDENRKEITSKGAYQVWQIDEKVNRFVKLKNSENTNIECY